jgi:shikimate kinase
VLVGLPGAGKTAAGRLAAERLSAEFVDVDEHIERRAGRSIPEIFAALGEPHFRRLEREEMERALDLSPRVIAPGGGWAAQPGALGSAAGRALVVYLETSPVIAARRVGHERSRPLLETGNPVRRMEELLAEREAAYRRAHAVLATGELLPSQVADGLVRLARTRAGW